jgi:hypothetical protein
MSSYLGNFENESKSSEKVDLNIVLEGFRNSSIPSALFFYKKYNSFPCTIDPSDEISEYLTSTHAYKVLKEEYNHDIKNDIVKYCRSKKHDLKYVSNQLSDLGNGVMISFESGSLMGDLESSVKIDYTVDKLYHVFYCFKIMFLPEKEEFVEKLIKSLESENLKVATEASLQMICKNQCSLYLTPIKIKKPSITDLKLHYGEEFEKIHNTILTALKGEGSHGLILLHGLPGSGKTHYIRYLIQEITGKQLIYVPPDMTSSISTPEFFPFMLQNTNSILIIEDAENIIKSRAEKGATTQAVANLLNLSDGLLGDSLHQPIIATFNCELNSIDSALLRKGRLIAQYEFGKLGVENAQKLSDQLGFRNKIEEPMTLADIYGQEK